MDELLRYFMDETNRQLKVIHDKLDDLQKFKVEMLASARMTSLIVSAVCGAVTLLSTLLIVYNKMGSH